MRMPFKDAMAVLERHGWQHLDTKNKEMRMPKYLVKAPGDAEPRWVRAGVLKAIVVHMIGS